MTDCAIFLGFLLLASAWVSQTAKRDRAQTLGSHFFSCPNGHPVHDTVNRIRLASGSSQIWCATCAQWVEKDDCR